MIQDIDKGWHELGQAIAGAGGYCLVGIVGPGAQAPHKGAKGLTVAQVGSVHEFGATITMPNGRVIDIPERSFIRATIDENREQLQRTATLAGRAVLLGKLDNARSLALIGEQAVGLMKKRISDGIPPPNAPITIARKGSSTPLIDKGQLRGSITYEVHA